MNSSHGIPSGPDVRRFWQHMIKRHPRELGHAGRATAEGTRWHPLDQYDLIVSLTLGYQFVRVFIRGEAGAKVSFVRKKLEPFEAELTKALGVSMSSDERDHFFVDRFQCELSDEKNWEVAADWLFERAEIYEDALNTYLKKQS